MTTCGNPRRNFLFQLGAGAGSLALSWLLRQDASASPHRASAPHPLAPKQPPLPPRAKAVIFLVMEGGPSQIDTFDPKPELEKQHGKVYQRGEVKTNQVRGKRLFVKSPFSFQRYGHSGLPVSELFSQVGRRADDLAVVRSVYADSDNHPAALFQYNTGFAVQGNPSMGSWIVYGLGSENQNLPAFVVLRDGKPYGGTATWSNGFLPAIYQGTQFRGGNAPVLNLNSAAGLQPQAQRNSLNLLRTLNQLHQQDRPEQSDLDARIASYELAFRMQSEIPAVADITDETEATRRLYGLDVDPTRDFGARCLLARRLVEQGVRFIQLWAGGWDSHDNLLDGHRKAAAAIDLPLAGLLTDLKQRGLLAETLVVWGGEFGRTADTTQAAWDRQQPGRDHNPRAMTMWFAGGGVRAGQVIGATDDVGEHSVEERHHLKNVHATLLHLLGLDQETLTFYHAGRFKRLTDTGGELIQRLIS